MIDDKIVGQFKARMHIFHTVEDEYLKQILENSETEIIQLTGVKDLLDKTFKELIFERSRYAYNDQLEFFEDNFRSQLIGLSTKGLVNDEQANV